MIPPRIVLADTSVWIDHLRSANQELVAELERGTVYIHPFVVGELACARLGNRTEILGRLQKLPSLPVATHPEVLHLIESQQLMGKGIGYVDAHLLASAALGNVRLWTRDRPLQSVAEEMRLG